MPVVNAGSLGRLVGVHLHFATQAALIAAVAANTADPLWADGSTFTVSGEAGRRIYSLSGDHVRTLDIGAGKRITLASNTNVVTRISGTPTGGSANDVAVNYDAGVYWLNNAGIWAVVGSILPTNAGTLAGATDIGTADLTTLNAPLAAALALRPVALPDAVPLGPGTTVLTHNLHANRRGSVAQPADATAQFTNAAAGGWLDGDTVYIRNVGPGNLIATGAITAIFGYTLYVPPGGVLSADYSAAADAWFSTTTAIANPQPSLSANGAAVTLTFPVPMYQGSTPASGAFSGTRGTGGSTGNPWAASSAAWTSPTTLVVTMATASVANEALTFGFVEGTGVGMLTLASRTPVLSFSARSVTNTLNAPAPVFTAASAPPGYVGYAYSYTYAANYATSFTVGAGTLPAGLALSSAGVLSGTPTTSATSNFAVSAVGAGGSTASGTQVVTVSATAPPIMETTWSGAAGLVNPGSTYTPDVTNAEGNSWVSYGAGFSLDGSGNMVLRNGGGATYQVSSRKNFTYSQMVQFGGGDAGMNFLLCVRCQDIQNAYLFDLTPSQLTYQTGTNNNYSSALQFTSPAASVVATTAMADGAAHLVELVMGSDNTLTYKIDGATIATAPIADIVAGKYGVGVLYYSTTSGSTASVTIANTKLG